MRPEPAALAFDARALSGVADVGAGESANDAIHDATPRLSIEGANVRPDRSRIQGARLNARRHIADDASAWYSESEPDVEPGDSSKEGQHSEGT